MAIKNPYFLYNNSEPDLKRIIKSVANSKVNETYALAKLEIIDLAMKGEKSPVNAFARKHGRKQVRPNSREPESSARKFFKTLNKTFTTDFFEHIAK